MAKVELSIIIVSFNTKEILESCLHSIFSSKNKIIFEVIVSDNASLDGSSQMVRDKFSQVTLIQNKHNLGFAKANNKAKKKAKGKYILFLNSDTVVYDHVFDKCIDFFKNNEELGALTCKVVLPSGKLDKDTRRSFPTPWVAFTHFSYLDRLFPGSAIFSKYWLSFQDENEIQEIDVLQGAFFLTKKSILDKLSWFDEEYFLDGEEIDLCWRIKQLGYLIIYYPEVQITHIKKASKKRSKKKSTTAGVASMEIFYRKRLWNRYPIYINWAVLLGIRALKLLRMIKSHI